MKLFLTLFIFSIQILQPAYGDDIETKLYVSCLRHNEKKVKQDQGGEAMCRCLAQKYASGKAKTPDNPSDVVEFEIKKEFISDLMVDWKNVESVPQREVGLHFNKKRNNYETITAEPLGIAFGFTCLAELKPDSFHKPSDRAKEIPQSPPSPTSKIIIDKNIWTTHLKKDSPKFNCAKAIPHTENGLLTGFLFKKVDDRCILKLLHLGSGDILRSINGKPLNNAAIFAKMFEVLESSNSFELSITHKTSTENTLFEIK